MSWLARLEITQHAALAEKIRDTYDWHQRLWECFPDEPASRRDFLTRIDPLEGMFQVWMLARKKPVCPRWCPEDTFGVKQIAPSFLSHRYFAFDLKANPVKSVVLRGPNGETMFGANGKRRHGKRVSLVAPEELRAWLIRKGTARCRDTETGQDIPGGFRIVDERPLDISPMMENHFRRKGQGGYHGGVQFRGVLEVTDRQHFTQTYYSGLGGAKSFGFGLFLLAPMNP